MSKDARSTGKINHPPPNRLLPEQMEKFITAALSKLKNFWKHENTLSGIQFYGDFED